MPREVEPRVWLMAGRRRSESGRETPDLSAILVMCWRAFQTR